MFRDEGQRNAVCRAILPSGLERVWSDRGPTLASLPACTTAERTMILLAHALWNGAGGLQVVDLMSLDSERLQLVGSLLMAISTGPDAIDAWLASAKVDETVHTTWLSTRLRR